MNSSVTTHITGYFLAGLQLLLIGMCLLSGCSNPPELKEFTFEYPDSSIRERWFEDRAGFKQGFATTYYTDGKKQTEAEFRNGYLHGEFVMWDTVGNEIVRGTYRKGEPWSGTFVSADPSGKEVSFQHTRMASRYSDLHWHLPTRLLSE